MDVLKYVDEKVVRKCQKVLDKEDYVKASAQIGHDADEIKRVFDVVFS